MNRPLRGVAIKGTITIFSSIQSSLITEVEKLCFFKRATFCYFQIRNNFLLLLEKICTSFWNQSKVLTKFPRPTDTTRTFMFISSADTCKATVINMQKKAGMKGTLGCLLHYSQKFYNNVEDFYWVLFGWFI